MTEVSSRHRHSFYETRIDSPAWNRRYYAFFPNSPVLHLFRLHSPFPLLWRIVREQNFFLDDRAIASPSFISSPGREEKPPASRLELLTRSLPPLAILSGPSFAQGGLFVVLLLPFGSPPLELTPFSVLGAFFFDQIFEITFFFFRVPRRFSVSARYSPSSPPSYLQR